VSQSASCSSLVRQRQEILHDACVQDACLGSQRMIIFEPSGIRRRSPDDGAESPDTESHESCAGGGDLGSAAHALKDRKDDGINEPDDEKHARRSRPQRVLGSRFVA
jgi:hypothetical protein